MKLLQKEAANRRKGRNETNMFLDPYVMINREQKGSTIMYNHTHTQVDNEMMIVKKSERCSNHNS